MLRRILNRIYSVIIFSFLSLVGFAQTQGGFDETMRSHNKIYVVMAVCLIILLAVLFYLIRIDIKISRKEKQNT